jgi:hypothetical protein
MYLNNGELKYIYHKKQLVDLWDLHQPVIYTSVYALTIIVCLQVV